MADRELSIKQLGAEHRAALKWFAQNAGAIMPWREIEAQADQGRRLATLAKGIYKPAYTDFALSVRQTLNSPYADKEVVVRPDGSWVYPYFQENPNPAARDQEATNRGLMKCLQAGVPVGVLIQSKPKPGVEYLVLGLGRVLEWKAGYFIVERFETEDTRPVTPDAAIDWVSAEIEPLQPQQPVGLREWQIRQVLQRRGQARFRASLIEAYDGRCCVSDCDALDALEAGHIAAYNQSLDNRTSNGLLLRADLHTLFDLGLLAIDPTTMMTILAPKLRSSTYKDLHQLKIRLPKNIADQPNAKVLRDHAVWAGLI